MSNERSEANAYARYDGGGDGAASEGYHCGLVLWCFDIRVGPGRSGAFVF